MTEFDPTDPGAPAARERAESVPDGGGEPIALGAATVRIGTAGWTDPTLIAPGVFYPEGATSAEQRLRWYASRFPLVEVDSAYYALPSRRSAELWLERTPPDFRFDVKAYALMTGHPTEVARFPRAIRETLPPDVEAKSRVYPKDLPAGVMEDVWRWFADAIEPLHSAGRMGAVLMQYPPWFHATRASAEAILDAQRRLAPVEIAVEFRHPSWLDGRVGRRTLEFLAEHRIPFVMVDEPQGTAHSVPAVVAVTSPAVAEVRCHGRRGDTWEKPGAGVLERFRYLYDRDELSEWVPRIQQAASAAKETHVVMNNCYANYGTTNAAELGSMLRQAYGHS
jgi:uncharacterized protein YecE (DUF72 family)